MSHTINDFNELQQKNKALEKLNREMDAIIENSYDAIYITDHEGKTLKTNSAIERLSGIPKEYYIGKNVQYLVERGILKESITLNVLKERKPVTIVQRNYAGMETMMTGTPVMNEHGEIEKVVTNIRDLSELNALHNKLEKAQELNQHYKRQLERMKCQKARGSQVISKSKKMREIFETADRVANVETTVLLLGETGVGKDVLARSIFRTSDRSQNGELIKVNCGAIPKELLESELFGYAPGAFTGAGKHGKPGMFELADGGILFLDEVGELPLSLQVKLLRVLQEKEIQRIGATETKKVDVRVIAATNRNLKKMVEKGVFRQDLFYRLHVLPFYIPPLRKRKEDILPLVDYFLSESNRKYHEDKRFSEELETFFLYYDWPGNVRELANLIERLVLTVPGDVIGRNDLPEEYKNKQLSPSEVRMMSLQQAVADAERRVLAQAAERCDNTYQMAEMLHTSQATIVRKMKKYQVSVSKQKS